jgi:gamma-glutamyltranspeptidase/glutathione hydrolase
VLLQALNLLEGYDLAGMGHNSADYIHAVVECLKLAFADREFYYGDEDFVSVPLARLLSKDYAAQRRRLVDPGRASHELRPGGYPAVSPHSVLEVNKVFAGGAESGAGRGTGRADGPGRIPPADDESPRNRPAGGDTTKLEVIDRAGNMVSATPSGGWLMSSPVVPGLGFPLGTRGQMFSLAAGHPNCLAPGKRPRTTLTPSLALRDGRPALAFGSPGGDAH